MKESELIRKAQKGVVRSGVLPACEALGHQVLHAGVHATAAKGNFSDASSCHIWSRGWSARKCAPVSASSPVADPDTSTQCRFSYRCMFDVAACLRRSPRKVPVPDLAGPVAENWFGRFGNAHRSSEARNGA